MRVAVDGARPRMRSQSTERAVRSLSVIAAQPAHADTDQQTFFLVFDALHIQLSLSEFRLARIYEVI